jgi:hypothetical protein
MNRALIIVIYEWENDAINVEQSKHRSSPY